MTTFAANGYGDSNPNAAMSTALTNRPTNDVFQSERKDAR